jgi:hypothetical protein
MSWPIFRPSDSRAVLPHHSPLQLRPCTYEPNRHYLAQNADKLQTWRNHGEVYVAVLHRNTGLFMGTVHWFRGTSSTHLSRSSLAPVWVFSYVDTGPPTHLLHTFPLSFAVAQINGVHTKPNTEVTNSIMLIVTSAECILFSSLLSAQICLLSPLIN